MPRIVVFAPAPMLTVTVEEHRGEPDVHVHVGGQGVWQARMLTALGADVTLVCAVGGEPGRVAELLLADEPFQVRAVRRDDASPAYVHDRRGGERLVVVESEGEPLDRHALDDLYSATLREAGDADLVILSGPAGEAMLEPEVYRRLASDMHALGVAVLVDLAGARLKSSLEGGVDAVKISHEELEQDGRVDDGEDEEQVLRAAREIAASGVGFVAVTLASAGSLVVAGDDAWRVHAPRLEVVDPKGAGDSYGAGVATVLAAGGDAEEAMRMGAAAGAINVTRHGLGTGDAEAIRAIAARVRLDRIEA